MSVPLTAVQMREALGVEYGTYVAAVEINLGGTRAFNVGDPVPVSHVERGVVEADQVKKVNTAGGREVIATTKEN